MDAEQLLNELIHADRDYVMASKPSFRADIESIRNNAVDRLALIRSQLLPLISSGLEMQRLQRWNDDHGSSEIRFKYGNIHLATVNGCTYENNGGTMIAAIRNAMDKWGQK